MNEIISLTRDLIRFKSTRSRPEEIERCARFVQAYLETHRIAYRRLDRAGTPSILVLPSGDFAPVLLMSHIDVVEAAEEQFLPVEKNGKLYGRGSVDDKYAVALSLVLLKDHVERGRRQGGGQAHLAFGILITGDEETGGADGAGYALTQFRSDFCIALDGGGLEKIVVREKGILHLKLVARGRSAHAARPWLGENAIEKLICDYGRITPFFEPPSTPDPGHWHCTLNLSSILGGNSRNQVPDYAEACFDVRYTENDDLENLVAAIRSTIKGELIVETVEPLFLSRSCPYRDRLAEAAPRAVFGSEHGASDARHLRIHGINGVVWGADGDLSQHSPQEHVVIDSVMELHRLIDRFVSTLPTHGLSAGEWLEPPAEKRRCGDTSKSQCR